MFIPNALATLLWFVPSASQAEPSVPPVDTSAGLAIELGVGATYGGAADDDGDIDVNNTIKGYEVSVGFVSAAPARSVFVDAQCGYSPKMEHYGSDLSVLRFRFLAGPKLRVGTESDFRAGLGFGFTKALTGGSGGTTPSLHALIGYFFPLDDYIGGLSLNYSRTLGKLELSRETVTWWGETSTYRTSIRLHDLALKFEWHIPVGSGDAAR